MRAETKPELTDWQSNLLAALRRDVADRAESEELDGGKTAPDRVEVLSFELAGETFGVDIRDMAEILLPRDVTVLPRTPPFVVGVLSLRGTVLPVIDLALRLGLPSREPTRASRVIVLKDGEERMGFRVDRVCGVIRFRDEAVEATDYSAAVDPRFLNGIGYDSSSNLVAVLSAERLCDFDLEDT